MRQAGEEISPPTTALSIEAQRSRRLDDYQHRLCHRRPSVSLVRSTGDAPRFMRISSPLAGCSSHGMTVRMEEQRSTREYEQFYGVSASHYKRVKTRTRTASIRGFFNGGKFFSTTFRMTGFGLGRPRGSFAQQLFSHGGPCERTLR